MEWLAGDPTALAARYIRHDASLSGAARSASLASLSRVLDKEGEVLARLERAPERAPALEFRAVCKPRLVPYLAQLNVWLAELTAEIDRIQVGLVRAVIAVAAFAAAYLRAHADAACDARRLVREWRACGADCAEFARARARRRALYRWGRAMLASNLRPDLPRLLQGELVVAMSRFDQAVNYAPPSFFDELLEDFMHGDPRLGKMVCPVAIMITRGDPAGLVPTMGELNLIILSKLGIKAGGSRSVVFICLVRFLFGIAYTIDPRPLIGDPAEKLAFSEACRRFSHQSVRDLQLSDGIIKNYTPGLQIASMFSSKHTDLLKPMELMTNPIDLLNHVHETLGILAAHFGSAGDFVSFDDMMTLLLALMSVNPPENAIAIAAFLTKWERVQLSRVITFAKNAYVGAVDQIRGFAG
jgi:hypothetical protein